MTINIALEQEQQQRVQDDLAVVENQKQEEASLNVDLYSNGYFEGYTGGEPSHPEQHSYWAGYQIGSREYWAKKRCSAVLGVSPMSDCIKKLGVEIPTEL